MHSNCQEINSQDKGTKEKKMVVYGSDTCHYCLDTKSFLIKNNIKFIYYDINKNQVKQNEMIAKLKAANISLSNLSLPVIDKNGAVFINNIEFEKFLHKLLEKF